MHSTHAYLPAIPANALGHGALGIPKESSIGPSARFAPPPLPLPRGRVWRSWRGWADGGVGRGGKKAE